MKGTLTKIEKLTGDDWVKRAECVIDWHREQGKNLVHFQYLPGNGVVMVFEPEPVRTVKFNIGGVQS